jgi:hypothetical protein
VARDAPEVGRIDEQLALRDAHGQDVGHVLVRDGVPVALPIHEAIDASWLAFGASQTQEDPRPFPSTYALIDISAR